MILSPTKTLRRTIQNDEAFWKDILLSDTSHFCSCASSVKTSVPLLTDILSIFFHEAKSIQALTTVTTNSAQAFV